MLSNTSDIPMRFSWRVPEDEAMQPREMQVGRGVGVPVARLKQGAGACCRAHTGDVGDRQTEGDAGWLRRWCRVDAGGRVFAFTCLGDASVAPDRVHAKRVLLAPQALLALRRCCSPVCSVCPPLEAHPALP